MKIGQNILGITLNTDGAVTAGRSIWAFGTRDGKEYFVKQFPSPKYPLESTPGSEEKKAQAKRDCQIFEARHSKLMEALRHKVSSGGSIVAPTSFGRVADTYYKIYEKIDIATTALADIVNMSNEQKHILLKVISHGVSILHNERIVHGDLKPDNLLIKQTGGSTFTIKIIDFDDAYFEGSPPTFDLIVGDQAFYSPEIAGYILSEGIDGDLITCKSDIFAMGLIFYLFLCGASPEFNRELHSYPGVAVYNGETLHVDGLQVPDKLRHLIRKMLARSPDERPSAAQVLVALKSLPKIELNPCEDGLTRSKIIGKSLGRTAESASDRSPGSKEGDGVPEDVYRSKIIRKPHD